MRRLSLLLIIPLIVAVGLSGCASGSGQATTDLMAVDYRQLPDDELLAYFYRLEDRIAVSEQPARRGSVSVGVSSGSVSGGSGSRVGMSTGRTRTTPATELRERHNEVRVELHRRGITP